MNDMGLVLLHLHKLKKKDQKKIKTYPEQLYGLLDLTGLKWELKTKERGIRVISFAVEEPNDSDAATQKIMKSK
jgi:hypothetical protein